MNKYAKNLFFKRSIFNFGIQRYIERDIHTYVYIYAYIYNLPVILQFQFASTEYRLSPPCRRETPPYSSLGSDTPYWPLLPPPLLSLGQPRYLTPLPESCSVSQQSPIPCPCRCLSCWALPIDFCAEYWEGRQECKLVKKDNMKQLLCY